MVIHVHRGHVPLRVRLDGGLDLLPRLAVVSTLEDGERSRWVVLFHERDDFTRSLVHGETTTLKPRLGNENLLAPGGPGIPAEPGPHAAGPEGGHHRAIDTHHHIGKSFPLENLDQLHRGLAEVSVKFTFGRKPGGGSGFCCCSRAGQRPTTESGKNETTGHLFKGV